MPYPGADGASREAQVDLPAGSEPHVTALVLPGLTLPGRTAPVAGHVASIAAALAERGVAAVRGQPRWAAPGGPSLSSVDWHGEVDDGAVALGWLAQQPWVDRSELYLVGVSLGGVAAPLLAGRNGQVAGIASWAATARPWPRYALATLRYQLLWRGMPAETVATALAASAWWHEMLRDTDLSAAELLAQNPAIGNLEVTAQGCMGRPTAFWRQLCRHDARAAHRGLSCRICTVRGSADFAAHAADQRSIVEAAAAAQLEVHEVTLEGLDHLLRPASSAREAFAGRVLGAPQYDRLADVIADWIGR